MNASIFRLPLLPSLLIATLIVVIPGAIADEPLPDIESAWFRNIRQLTSPDMGLDRSGEAYFSADVRRICFQAYPTGQTDYQIYVMNLDGTGLKMVSTGTGATTCSFFHPSGEKMIFAANHHDQRPAPEPEQPRPGGHPGGHPHASSGGHPSGEHPAADQGKPPAIPRHRSHAWKYYPGMDIFEYTFATGQLRQLTASGSYDAECAYSPDGRHIVFSSLRDGDQEIYICDADGRNPRRITNAPGGDGGPFFSPAGQHVVYRSDRTGTSNLQIFINNFAGTEERAITGNAALHWCPFWHPSGKWVIFTHADFRGRPNFDLYVLRVDGSAMHRVTSDPAFDGLPVFSPDGRYLMWTSTRGGLEAPQIFLAEFTGLTPGGELHPRALAVSPPLPALPQE